MDHIIFIKEELENILLIKENNYCFECSSNDNEWVSISYGILICLECAGKHRNLGVQISYVKSIYLDTWSIEQIECVKQGGNKKLKEYFKFHNIDQLPFDLKYHSDFATIYRQQLKESAQSIIEMNKISQKLQLQIEENKRLEIEENVNIYEDNSDQICNNKNNDDENNNKIVEDDKVERQERQEIQDHQELKLNCLEQKDNSNTEMKDNISFEFTFWDGPIGMTLEKDQLSRAKVARVLHGGSAHTKGVCVGDMIESISGRVCKDYEELMDNILLLPRPVQIKFVRPRPQSILTIQSISTTIPLISNDLNNSFEESQSETNNSPSTEIICMSPSSSNLCEDVINLPTPPKISRQLTDFRVSFPSLPFGMTVARGFQNSHRSAVVTRIVPNGYASQLGIEEGDSIVGIENQWVEGYDDFFKKIKETKKYPISLVIRRTNRKERNTN